MNKKKSKKSKLPDKIPTNTILSDNKLSAKKDILSLVEGLDSWKQDFLMKWLCSGSVSTVSLGFDDIDVAVALKVDKKFNTIHGKIRKILDKVELMKLERVSEENALNSKSMVERLFRLKSLDRDRYADRGANIGANVQVNIAFGDGVQPYHRTQEKKETTYNTGKNMKDIVSTV